MIKQCELNGQWHTQISERIGKYYCYNVSVSWWFFSAGWSGIRTRPASPLFESRFVRRTHEETNWCSINIGANWIRAATDNPASTSPNDYERLLPIVLVVLSKSTFLNRRSFFFGQEEHFLPLAMLPLMVHILLPPIVEPCEYLHPTGPIRVVCDHPQIDSASYGGTTIVYRYSWC